MPTFTRLDGVATYHLGLPPMESHDPLSTRFCKTTLKTKNISPLPQCQWPPDLAGW